MKPAPLPSIRDIHPRNAALIELKRKITSILESHEQRNRLHKELEKSVVAKILNDEPEAHHRRKLNSCDQCFTEEDLKL